MAIIRKYVVKIEEIVNPLPDVFTVSFSSQKKIKYLPGQFLHLALDDYDGIGQWPESRCFSMQSNPDDELIRITFAAKGSFTNRMATELKAGKEIWLKMPYGDVFQRGHNTKNCVFIAGGTGLTPFLSLLTSSLFSEYENPFLYAGFKNKSYNIFGHELETSKSQNGQLEINTIYQDIDGILNIEHILHNSLPQSTFFISGPPVMIKNFKKYLINEGISESKIITDDWE